MSVEKNKKVVLDYVDAILRNRDFTNFSKFTTPDFYIDRSAVPDAIKGEEGLHTQMDMLYESFPDLELKVVDVVAEGDKVVVRFAAPGTHKASFAGIEPTGRTVTWKGLVMYHVVGDKIKEAWANWDDYGLIQQL